MLIQKLFNQEMCQKWSMYVSTVVFSFKFMKINKGKL